MKSVRTITPPVTDSESNDMLSHSPSIVTDGLVLCLDAANRRSYPGSGTSWLDLSGQGNNGVLTNGPTFTSTNGGSIALDGVNDYVTLSGSTSFSSGNNSRTISLGYLPSQIYTRRTCLFFYGNSGSTAQGFMVSSHTDGKRTQVQTYGNQASAYGNTDWSTSQMNFITVTYDGSTVRYYMNGSLDGTATFSITPNTILSLSPLIGEHPIGWGGENFAYGKIPFVHVYSKLLSADEVRRNYLATKSRFNL